MMIADRYELGDVIGTGGMSDVYAATDTVLGRGVAAVSYTHLTLPTKA